MSVDDRYADVVAAAAGAAAVVGQLSQQVNTLADALAALKDALDGEDEDPDEEPPFDITVSVETTGNGATVTWLTERTDVTSWRIGRDGEDTQGSGPWSTEVPPLNRTQVFNLLKSSTSYNFTLTPVTAAGPQKALTVTGVTKAATTVPPGGDGQTAAAARGWGVPHPISDEFDYEGRPNPEKWKYCGDYGVGWEGHNKNGRRMPENSFVKDGILTLRGDANGNTGWLRQNHSTRYGRWEIRSRSRNTGSAGGLYHPLHLIWPTNPEKWPDNGELDFVEYTNPDAQEAGAWLHYPHPSTYNGQRVPIQQAGPFHKNCDMTQWHNFAFEWDADGCRSWIDGVPWYEVRDGAGPYNRKNIQDMTMGRLTIQLDNFTGDGGLRPAVFEVAWVRFWPVA